jgi:FixJ family two-component response regulator
MMTSPCASRYPTCFGNSASRFARSRRLRVFSILIAVPGLSGPDLQRELKLSRQDIPIIFITAHGDPTVRQRVVEQGAVECLLKPFSDAALFEALNAALE